MQWNIGVDTHKGSFDIGVVDETGREIDATYFANDEEGYREALEWIRTHQGQRSIGVECSGSYGAPLTRMLIAAGEDVSEVPPMLTHRERRKSPAKGKSDRIDAFAIAKVVARGEGLAKPRVGDIFEELKLLSDERNGLVVAKTQLANQTHGDLVILRPGYHKQLPQLTRKKHLAEAKKLLRGDRSVRAELVRRRLADIDRLTTRIEEVTRLVKAKVLESGTTLHAQYGVSFVLAATILGEVGDPSRIHSEGAFAMMNGTAPVQASSGKVKHHRLNRRGNRSLNCAVHTVALVRARGHEQTQTFLAKKRGEGKSNKDAVRCLKRHVSNMIFRQMMLDLEAQKRAA